MIKSNPITEGIKKSRKKLHDMCSGTKEDIEKIVEHYDDLDDIAFLHRLNLIMKEYASKMVEGIEELIVEEVKLSILTTLFYYRNTAPFHVPENKLDRMENKLQEQFLNHTYKGKTFKDRIRRLEKSTAKNIRKEIDFASNHDLDREDFIERVYERFYYEGVIHGGNLRGSSDTLLVGEQTRFYREASISFFNFTGVRYVRFCLVPQHKGDDICNELAKYEDVTLIDRLKGKDISPEGVYRFEDLPKHPHPRALYYLQPLYDFGFSPLLIKRN